MQHHSSLTGSFLRRGGLARWAASLFVGALLAGTMPAQGVAPPAGVPPRDEFSRMVQLAPFIVRGQQLSISIHARSDRDRRYAQGVAEEVLKVIYESGVTQSTGKGLVIIGRKGEPHPIRFFRQFLALAEAGKLDPAVAARGPELFALIEHWQQSGGNRGRGAGGRKEGGVDLEFERIATALPLPLEGVGARLYQLAWAEKFDETRVEARLRALRAADLEGDLFVHYDWVFYLPPKGAFDQVLDELIAEALKEDDPGFFARMAVKSVMLVVKPKIRQAIEGMRHGMMFDAVARARAGLSVADISALTGTYIEELMPDLPDERKRVGPEHERAVNAVRAKLEELQAARAAADVEKPAPDAAPSSSPGT